MEGVAYDMSPAPSLKHQGIVWHIIGNISNCLATQEKCRGFSAPTDVVLEEHNVVQPDVFVLCDQSKIGEQTVRGAPDLVIE